MVLGNVLTDLETKYNHLLQPIRDLAKNWDVDIASHLEEYLDEIDKIEITFDGGSSKMNFAEAAMLIQGSACVYSKKVEHLYSMVFQVLDLFASKKKQQQKLAALDKNGNDQDGDFEKTAEEAFLALDDLKDHIKRDLRLAEINNTQTIALAPSTLQRLQGTADGDRYITSRKGDIIGRSHDFRLNNPNIHTSAFNVFDLSTLHLISEGEIPLLTEDIHQQRDIDMEEIEIEPTNLNQSEHCSEVGDLPLDNSMPELPMDDEPSMHIANRMELRERVPVQIADRPNVSLVNFWVSYDPHETTEAKEHCYKKGKTFRIPKELEPDDTRKRKRKKQPELAKLQSISEFCTVTFHKSSAYRLASDPLKVPTFPELEALYVQEQKRRSNIKERHRKMMTLQGRVQHVENELYDRPENEDNNIDINDDVDDLDDDDGGAMEHQVTVNFDGTMLQAGVGSNTLCSDNGSTEPYIGDSYEELVRHYVDGFLDGAQRYAQLTDLAQRVSAWEEKIIPTLQEQETHEAFDIHRYGTLVLDTFGEETTKETTTKIAIPFKTVVHSKPSTKQPYQVARLFLATLQLANNYNLEISTDGDLEVGMNTMKVKFLSDTRHHEQFEDYQAPSLH